MAVRLDKVPPSAERPSPPSVWLWLGLLLVALLAGFGLTLWLGGEAVRQRPLQFWGLAVGLPVAIWLVLLLVGVLAHLMDISAADGWNRAREEDLLSKLRRGRRVQQVLAVSLYSALREETDESGLAQMQALVGDQSALQNQAVRGNDELHCRHSQLPEVLDPIGKALTGEALLSRLYRQVLTDLEAVLNSLPTERPLALLLETDSALPQSQQLTAWSAAWAASGIRQATTLVQQRGLDAVDHWLDARIDDQALLLVVAVQFLPAQLEDSAEVAVGLLFGNRRTQTTLAPLAYLHRPEQERGMTAETLHYATQQALNWVPMAPAAIEHLWLSGIDVERQGDVTQALLTLPSALKHGQGLHDLDASLGHAGGAAPWLAIATAVDVARTEGKPQLIISGERSAQIGLWSTAVTPVTFAE